MALKEQKREKEGSGSEDCCPYPTESPQAITVRSD